MNQTVKKIFQNYISSTGTKSTVFIILFGFLLAILGASEPLIFTEFIKEIEYFLSTGEMRSSRLIILSFIWGGFTISYIVLAYIFDYFFLAKTIIKNYHDQSLHYARKITQMTFSHYLSKEVGTIYKILDRGTENQLFFLYSLLLGVLRSISSILFISVILFLIDWRMAIATLILVPVALGIGNFVYKTVSPTQKKLDEEYIRGFGILGNGLSNFGLIKTLGLEDVFFGKMKKIFETSYKKQLHVNKGWSLGHGYTAAIVIFARIIVMAVGFLLISQGEITFSTLFLFFSYIGWIYFPLGFLFEQLRQFQKYLTAVEIMHEQFDTLDYEETKKGKNLKNPKGNISFQDVSFGYTDDKQVLKNINFDIESGQKIALVGNTGAGKSTIVNLLLRFWETSEGEILLDGQTIILRYYSYVTSERRFLQLRNILSI